MSLSRARHLSIPLLFVVVAMATLAPAWRDAGWPFSHEGPGFFQRTQVYAQHAAVFDLIPIWSSVDANGFGSPMPLMYHKLFYLVAGPLALALGSLKVANIVTLCLMLTIGACGMFAAARVLHASVLASVVAGVSLLGANYTVTSWLVRGAVAEHGAMMLVPWVFYFVLTSLRDGRLAPGLGVALALTWFSHSVLAYFLGLLLAVAFVVLAIARVAPLSLLHPRTAWPALVLFALPVAPFLLMMWRVAPAYDFSRIIGPTFRPANNFRPFVWYFWDRHWQWGRTVAGLTLQIDLPMLALLVVTLTAIAVGVRNASTPIGQTWRRVAPMLLVAAMALVLQLEASNIVYRTLPGALYVQFPWRLLAVLTPALILGAIALADAVFPERYRLVGLGVVGAWMLAGSGAFVPIHERRLDAPDAVSLTHLSFSGFREYEPTAATATTLDMKQQIVERWHAAGCTIERRAEGTDVVNVEFEVSCPRTTALPLPIYASPFHGVVASGQTRAVRCFAIEDFPATCGATVPAGAGVVSVQMPTIGALARHAVGRR